MSNKIVHLLVAITFIPTALFSADKPAKPTVAASASPSATSTTSDQVPVAETLIATGNVNVKLHGKVKTAEDQLSEWSGLYNSGNWDMLQAGIRETLNGARINSTGDFTFKDLDSTCSTVSEYYSVVFVSFEKDPAGQELRVLVHCPQMEKYSQRLPKLKPNVLYTVFVAADAQTTLRSSYVMTRKQNPLLQNVPGFFKQFDLKTLTGFAGNSPMLRVFLTRSDLPFTRGTLAIKDKVTVPPQITPEVSMAGVRASFSANFSPCTKKLTVLTLQGISDAIQTNNPADPLNLQIVHFDTAVRSAYVEALKDSVCTNSGSGIEAEMVKDLETSLRALIQPTPSKEIAGDFTYEVAPLTHLDLGVGSSLILSTHGSNARVKVDNGKISPNQLSGTISMALLNYHPIAYDPNQFSPNRAERFHFFGGLCLAPEFGLSAGAGYSLVRGLSLDAGISVLRIDTLRKGDAIGEAPSNSSNPFRNGSRTAFFIGLSYAFP